MDLSNRARKLIYSQKLFSIYRQLALGYQDLVITRPRHGASHAQTPMTENSFPYQTFAHRQVQEQDLSTAQQIKGTQQPFVPLLGQHASQMLGVYSYSVVLNTFLSILANMKLAFNPSLRKVILKSSQKKLVHHDKKTREMWSLRQTDWCMDHYSNWEY